jgi:hypothetical protein
MAFTQLEKANYVQPLSWIKKNENVFLQSDKLEYPSTNNLTREGGLRRAKATYNRSN